MGEKRLIILRGLPGSGKTTMGFEILANSKIKGVLLSANDFFKENPKFKTIDDGLTKAKRWNSKRVENAMKDNVNLIIVDDTHGQIYDMLPLVRNALKFCYKIEMLEPQTPWRENPQTCFAKSENKKLFSEQFIVEMSARWDRSLTDADQLVVMVDPSLQKQTIAVEESRPNEQQQHKSPSNEQAKGQVDETPPSTPRQSGKSPEYFTPLVETGRISSPQIQRLTSPSQMSEFSDAPEDDAPEALTSPLTLFELCYVCLLNHYPHEDVENTLANLFYMANDDQQEQELETAQTEASASNLSSMNVPLSFPVSLLNQLHQIFHADQNLELDCSEEITCDIPMDIAWRLYSSLVDKAASMTSIQQKPRPKRAQSTNQSGKDSQVSSSLLEIMAEQQSQTKMMEGKMAKFGLTPSTFYQKYRFALQLLEEKFSSIGRQTLEEIFLDNNCNFNVTLATLNLINNQPENEVVLADFGPTFAIAAKKVQPENERTQTPETQMPKMRPLDPVIIVSDKAGRNTAFDRPQLRYDESRFYTELPDAVDRNLTYSEASEMRERRKELATTVKRMHAQGMHTAASYYSQQLRDLKTELANVEQEAALEIIHRRNANITMQNFIDLHGLKVREALKTVDALIDQKMNLPFRSKSRYLYIITGVGKHSEDGRSRLRPAVIHYLRHSRKLDFTLPHNSVIKVDLHTSL